MNLRDCHVTGGSSQSIMPIAIGTTKDEKAIPAAVRGEPVEL
ncbi:MAG: hypothetical protein SVO26_06685 [Chloroflexota bacterium]|nr:hypothetical protein [Chloroflexota bacterium]